MNEDTLIAISGGALYYGSQGTIERDRGFGQSFAGDDKGARRDKTPDNQDDQEDQPGPERLSKDADSLRKSAASSIITVDQFITLKIDV